MNMQMVAMEQRVANEAPNPAVAYALWFFLGFFGAHFYYVGRPDLGKKRLVMLAFFWLYIPILITFWNWIADFGRIGPALAEARENIRKAYA